VKNALASFFRFVLQSLGLPRRASLEERIPPEQLREALMAMLRDPQTRRLLLRELIGAPAIAGGSPSTPAEDVQAGQFGANCTPPGGDYTFPAKLTIGTASPAQTLEGGTFTSYGPYPGPGFALKLPDNWSGGWARGYMFTKADGTIMAGLWGHGTASPMVLDYAFIGASTSDQWMTFLPAGNVGIGRSPAQKLDVAGNIGISGTEIVTSGRVLQNVTADGSIIASGTVSAAHLPVASASAAGMVSTDAQAFSGDKTLEGGTFTSYGPYPGPGFALKLPDDWSGGWARGYMFTKADGTVMAGLWGHGTASPMVLDYAFIGASISDQWMTFLPSGKVGIGTTAPAEKLDVSGNLRVEGNSAFGPGTVVHNSQDTGYVVVFVDSTYTDTQQEVPGIDAHIRSAFVDTLDETTDGWDRFGLGASVKIAETNKEYIRGQQKGVAAELYTYTPAAIDAWQPNHSYSFQKLVRPTVDNGRYYRVVTGGTSGSSEPAWPPSDGGIVTDNSVEWQETPLVETMFGFQSYISVASRTSVGEWYGVIVAPPAFPIPPGPPPPSPPGTIRTGYGVLVRNLGENSTGLPPANAAAIKIEGLGNYGRILWTSCSVYCSSSGILEFNATTANFSGVVSSATGFRIGGAAAPSGHYLRGNGSNFVDSAIQAADIPNLDASKITTGVLASSQIPSLDASKITTGVFASSQIPGLDASKITSGQFADARMPAGVVMMKDGSTKKLACGMELVSAASGGTPGSVTVDTGLSSIAAVAIAHVWTTSANAAGTVSNVSGGSFHLNNELNTAEYFYWIAIGT
jgi:hypothetical protein